MTPRLCDSSSQIPTQQVGVSLRDVTSNPFGGEAQSEGVQLAPQVFPGASMPASRCPEGLSKASCPSWHRSGSIVGAPLHISFLGHPRVSQFCTSGRLPHGDPDQ